MSAGMECKITFTSSKRPRGFTLVELMIAIAISSLVLAALTSFVLFSMKSFAAMFNYVDLEQKSQNAVNTLTREIRQAQALTYFTTTELAFRDYDSNLLTYSWSPNSRALVRVKNGETKALLTECDNLSFDIWQRSPIQGTWSNYSATIVTNTKLVNVSWTCSRKILGATLNTESVQTAKIVIRNN